MKRFFASATAVALFTLVFGSTAFAATTAELELVSGGTTLYVLDNGAVTCAGCATFSPTDTNPLTGAININATGLNGWSITISNGTSNSPNCSGSLGPGCLDNTTISTQSSGAGTLTAYFADSGFATQSGLSVTLSASAINGTGSSVMTQGFKGTGALPAPSLLSTFSGTQIGSNLTLNVGGGFAGPTSGLGATGPFDLELVTTFTAGSGGGSFNADSTIAAPTPEPSAVILFGTVLLLVGTVMRRRKIS